MQYIQMLCGFLIFFNDCNLDFFHCNDVSLSIVILFNMVYLAIKAILAVMLIYVVMVNHGDDLYMMNNWQQCRSKLIILFFIIFHIFIYVTYIIVMVI